MNLSLHVADGRPSLPIMGPTGAVCRQALLEDVQLVEQAVEVVSRLQQVLVVLDHLAAHVDAQPLLVHEQLVAVEAVGHRHVAVGDEPGEEERALEAQGDRLEVRRADRRVAEQEHRGRSRADRRAPTGATAGS